MKTIALFVLALCLPVFADDFAVTFDKDGALSIDGKKVDESACTEALKAAGDKCKKDKISALKLAIRCAPETPWGPVQRCINEAAEAGVWDIRLTVGDKSVAIPLPKDGCNDEIYFPDEDEEGGKKDEKNDLGTGGGGGGGNAKPAKGEGNRDKNETKRLAEEIRVIAWTGETGDIGKDSAAKSTTASTKTWARLNQGPVIDISADASAVLRSVRAMIKDEEAAGTKDPATIFDIAPSVAMKQVFSMVAALKDSAKGSPRVEFAMPLPTTK
ncbi:MAG: hypothetical protein K8T20_05505 [Planctomycetes bacterium]|nr:hypothetical protein [Planctomycetota bacterium]